MQFVAAPNALNMTGFAPSASGILLPSRHQAMERFQAAREASHDPEPTCVLIDREIEISFVIRKSDLKPHIKLGDHPTYPVAQRYFFNKDLPDVVGVLHEYGILDFSWEQRPFEITQGRRRRTTFPTEFHRSLSLKGSNDSELGKPQVEIVQTGLIRKLLRPFADRGAITKERTLYQEDGRAEVKFVDMDGVTHSAYIAIDKFTRAGKGKKFGELSKSPFLKIEVEFDTVEARHAFLAGGHRFDWILAKGILSNAEPEQLRQFKNRYVAKHGQVETRVQDLRVLKREILPKAA